MEKQNKLADNEDQRRTTAAERARVLEHYRASGLTRLAYCQREGFSIYKLDSWLRKDTSKGTSKQKKQAVELRELRWDSAGSGNWAMELISPSGWTIRGREPIGVEEILRLLRTEKC